MHVNLDKRTNTIGVVLSKHIRTFDIKNGKYTEVEHIPKDILENVISVVFSVIE